MPEHQIRVCCLEYSSEEWTLPRGREEAAIGSGVEPSPARRQTALAFNLGRAFDGFDHDGIVAVAMALLRRPVQHVAGGVG